eukprot:2255211-Rhodomonas_salina.2
MWTTSSSRSLTSTAPTAVGVFGFTPPTWTTCVCRSEVGSGCANERADARRRRRERTREEGRWSEATDREKKGGERGRR